MRILKSTILVSFVMLAISILLLASSCKTTKKPTVTRVKKENNPELTIFDGITKSEDIGGLVKELTGTFTAAGMDEDSTTYEVTLQVVPIWPTKTDKYLYVEQGPTSSPEAPSRQRIYQVKKDNAGGFEIHVHILNEPEAYIGKWAEPNFFAAKDESIMAVEEGCSIYLIQHADGSFSGSTRMDHCKNTEQGAAYLTTIMKVREENILIWDQGFDADKKQVWGLKQRGYRYVRK